MEILGRRLALVRAYRDSVLEIAGAGESLLDLAPGLAVERLALPLAVLITEVEGSGPPAAFR